MPAFIDLSGKIFGRLKVVNRAKINKRNKPAWLCKCDCGNLIEVAGNELRVGNSNSCGCLRKDLLRIDLLGKKFGKLKVLGFGDKRGKSSSQFWLCKCECGNEKVLSASHLIKRQIVSCGCLTENDIDLDTFRVEFFNNVEKSEDCWIWKGPKMARDGYGIFFADKMIRAHRFSYILLKGNIQKNKMICHTCDNRLCVNPNHLYAGTAKDNTRDMVERGRGRKSKKPITTLK